MRAFATVALLSMFLMGCNASSGPPPVPAGGKVTLSGKAIEGAIVTFLTKEGTGRSASGKTEADGSFKLSTINTNDGAPPGDYVITITKQEIKGSGSSGVDISKDGYGAAYGAAMSAAAKGDMSKVQKDLIPKKYSSPTESGLTRSVVKGEPNEFTFEL